VLPSTVFKTAAIDHSAISPGAKVQKFAFYPTKNIFSAKKYFTSVSCRKTDKYAGSGREKLVPRSCSLFIIFAPALFLGPFPTDIICFFDKKLAKRNMLKVAIVILNWNGKQFLEKFLPSVIKHCPGYAHIVVADNGSTDDSGQYMATEYPDIKYIALGENYGYTGGYNRALAQIEAQYCILLNSDIDVAENWIEPLVEFMDSNEDVAACQPKILAHDQREKFEYAGASGGYIDRLGYPFCRGRVFDYLEYDQGQYNDITDVFWATGACMFVRATDFRAAGGLDDDFFAHMEEIDLCWRFKRMNKRVVCCPESVIYHVGGGTLPKNNPRKTFLNFRNNLVLLAKNLPAHKFYIILFQRLFLDLTAAIKFLLNGQKQDSYAVIKAFFSVLKIFRRKRHDGRHIPYRTVSEIYKNSIVADYFLLKKKRFSQLDPARFGNM
jgi:GT2 family glycosyltransferase